MDGSVTIFRFGGCFGAWRYLHQSCCCASIAEFLQVLLLENVGRLPALPDFFTEVRVLPCCLRLSTKDSDSTGGDPDCLMLCSSAALSFWEFPYFGACAARIRSWTCRFLGDGTRSFLVSH